MIKMISFNNFDNFDGKKNASSEAETNATAQNFTAILSGFSPISPKPEKLLPNTEISVKQEVSDAKAVELIQLSSETDSKSEMIIELPPKKTNQDIFIQKSDIEAVKNFMFPPQNFKAEKTISGSQTENETLIETSLPQREETSLHKIKTMPEQMAHLYQNEDPAIKQNGEIINGKIQVNHLYQPDTTKEMVADAPERLPILQTGNEKNLPSEGRILTQFDNTDSKQPSIWSRDQSISREIPNEIPKVRISNIANEERREGNVRFISKQDNILDLPENDFPPMNADIKENPILTIENGKTETVEILSVESSFSKPVNKNFLVENKSVSVEKVLAEENKTPVLPKIETPVQAKIEIPKTVSELKSLSKENVENENKVKNLNSSDKVLSGLNPLNVVSFENTQVKPTAGQNDILEFPEIQISASEEIIEIKTDNFQLLDLTQSETSEINHIPIKQDFTADEFELKTFDEKSQDQLNQQIKTDIPQAVESKINTDSVQFKNLKYFFNFDTNRLDEVKTSDLPADSAVFSETGSANLEKDFPVKSQPINNLTKLYDKVSEIVREDAVSEKVRAEIKAAETGLENQIAGQVEDLWAGYSNDNRVFTTNSIRGSNKPREVFSESVHTTNSIRENHSRSGEVFDEFGVIVENSNSQDFAKPQIINSTINQAQGRVDFTNQNVNLQNPQIFSQISLTQAEKPIPKPDKPLEMPAKISDLNFEKFLNPAINEAEIIKVTPNSLIEDSAVFEQIEPKINELAKSVDKTGETDILKMRLNPAELGEIEIRLEKDASGKINAQIQTKTEAAQHILAENLGQLRESLQNAGWQVEKLEISYNANQSNGNEPRENGSREFETEESGRKNAFGFDGNLENEDETAENPLNRLVNLRA